MICTFNFFGFLIKTERIEKCQMEIRNWWAKIEVCVLNN